MSTTRLPPAFRAAARALPTGAWLGAATLLAIGGALVPSVAAAQHRSYDIPAQALEAALLTLGRQSGIDVLYQHGVLDGLTSAPLRGDFSPPAAVATLLRSTGLRHRFTSATAVLILPAALPATSGETARAAPDGNAPRLVLDRLRVTTARVIGSPAARDYRPFGQTIRTAISRQLQQDPRTSKRQFKVRIAIELDARGVIHGLRVQRGSGQARLDRDIAQVLNGASMPGPPPAGLPQPIWFEIDAK
ncbi:TonB family protein [Sphingomonas psychrotolerans]|uniref:TonB family protein n=1 Tax=Sphingomonas psychrotolerans TaxID=1327635 RepID=UPI0013050C3A|nr:TonB family protein [Sphingomonas psychrotolerans]